MQLTDAIANYMLIVLTLSAFNTALLVALVFVATGKRKWGGPNRARRGRRGCTDAEGFAVEIEE